MVSRAEISGEWDDGWSDGMSEVKLKFTFLFIQLQIVFSVIFRMNMKKAIQVIRVIRWWDPREAGRSWSSSILVFSQNSNRSYRPRIRKSHFSYGISHGPASFKRIGRVVLFFFETHSQSFLQQVEPGNNTCTLCWCTLKGTYAAPFRSGIPESLLSDKWFTKKKKPALILLVALKEFFWSYLSLPGKSAMSTDWMSIPISHFLIISHVLIKKMFEFFLVI